MSNTFLYKCRRCGGINRNVALGGNPMKAMRELINALHDEPFNYPSAPHLTSIHNCGNDAYGVADLIGCEPDKE